MRVRNTDYLVSVPSNSFGFQARLLGTRQSKGSVNSSEGGRRRPTNAPTRGSRSPGRDTRRKRERRGEKTIEEAIRAAAAAAAASVTYSTPPHSTMTSLHVRQLAPPATIALLLAVVAGSFAFPAQDADFGSEGVRVKRVAGGQKVEVTVVPYQAKIEHPNGICGATIIHPSFVLTAKHCVKFKMHIRRGNYRATPTEGRCGVTVARRASAAAAVVAHGAARPRLRDKAQLDERADGLPRERPPHRRHGRHRLVRRIGRPLVVRRQADGVVKAGAAGGESIAVTKYTRWPVRRAVASKVKEAEESAWASRGRAPSTLGTHAESHSRIGRLPRRC
ncbi:Anionic trypsin-2 [Gryllus bimaculatus]|nr:Anionic trypsin-2 [Gryllus bimaculatus]